MDPASKKILLVTHTYIYIYQKVNIVLFFGCRGSRNLWFLNVNDSLITL